jgi:cobalt-zinc-cadmium efflux system membrane fusion protein
MAKAKGEEMKRFIVLTMLLAGIVLAAVLYRQFQPAAETPERGHIEQEHDNHDEHDEEADHHDHDGDHEEGEEKVVRLTPEEIKEFGIEVREAGAGSIKVHLNLPGEVAVNADRLAHVVPRVPGIVREVKNTLGDRVEGEEVMAVLESRELADAKSDYLAAKERLGLARANFNREKNLWNKKISSEQEYLSAKQGLAEMRIELRSAEQKLHALGFSESYLDRLPGHADVDFTRYEIRAPLSGTVIEKHITIGEVLKEDAEAFVIADLKTVWVNLSVYQKDLPFVQAGLEVTLSVGQASSEAKGTISYLGPIVGEQTRTATAQVVLPNPDGRWKPGLFVNARVEVGETEVPVAVPKTAIQTMEDQPSVFVHTGQGFVSRTVTLGKSNEDNVEVVSGLEKGERYVSSGAFTLKAEIGKESFGDGHGH